MYHFHHESLLGATWVCEDDTPSRTLASRWGLGDVWPFAGGQPMFYPRTRMLKVRLVSPLGFFLLGLVWSDLTCVGVFSVRIKTKACS